MATPEKAAAIVELTEKFRSSGAAVLTEYRGLKVSQITELRNSMREHATYAVVKNTLTKRAAAEAGIDGLDEHLVGPTAIAFVTGDPVEAAKGLRDFAKANPALVIKAGVLDGKPLTPEEITTLADLESREVLLAKLAGAMKGNLSKAVGLFAAPLSTTARVVEQLRAKVEEQGGPLAVSNESSESNESSDSDESQDTPAEADAEATPAEADAEATTDVAEGGDES